MLRHDSSQKSADCDRVLMQGDSRCVQRSRWRRRFVGAAGSAAYATREIRGDQAGLYHLVWISRCAVCWGWSVRRWSAISLMADGKPRRVFVGPFSPICGVGGVVMTLALARLSDARGGVLFRRGGCCRGLRSVVPWMVLGTRSALWPGIILRNRSIWAGARVGHRACGRSCRCGVGEAGVAGDAARSRYGPQYGVRRWPLGIAGVFLVDTVVTFAAFDCWMNRLAGAEPSAPCAAALRCVRRW